MDFRKEFKEKTGLSHETTGIFCNCNLRVDIWNDKYILWLETELKKLRVADFIKNEVAVCVHKNEIPRQGDGFVYVVCGDCGEQL